MIDPELIATLPQEEHRAGMAEVVKTGLLAGVDVWDLAEAEMIRACAAYKSGVCLTDPTRPGAARSSTSATPSRMRSRRPALHGRHGDAGRARPDGRAAPPSLPTDVVETVLDPRPVAVDRERAWEALQRDKKIRDGRIRLVLLEAPGNCVGRRAPRPRCARRSTS